MCLVSTDRSQLYSILENVRASLSGNDLLDVEDEETGELIQGAPALDPSLSELLYAYFIPKEDFIVVMSMLSPNRHRFWGRTLSCCTSMKIGQRRMVVSYGFIWIREGTFCHREKNPSILMSNRGVGHWCCLNRIKFLMKYWIQRPNGWRWLGGTIGHIPVQIFR